MARYRVGPEKHYREGRFYEEGDLVDIPEDELPHESWIPVQTRKAPTKPASAKLVIADEIEDVEGAENVMEPEETVETAAPATGTKGKRKAAFDRPIL